MKRKTNYKLEQMNKRGTPSGTSLVKNT